MSKKGLILKEIHVDGYEQVVEVINESVNLHGIIAIHSTHLGPACGGIRAYPYKSFDQALTDVLRLAKGMTYKSAVAKTGTGGAKSVLILDKPQAKTKELLLSFAEAINHFKGKYYGGEDMGINAKDLEIMREKTPYVVGLTLSASSGDPSNYTARGIYRGIQAVCQKLWNNSSVKGKKILVQGLGSVGMKLIQHLFWDGAELIVSDVNPAAVEEAVTHWSAKAVSTDNVYETACDIFSPCAVGGILNPKTIPLLKCKAVAGAANNQLLTDDDAYALIQRKILYAPDFVINAGGLINIASEVKHNKYNPIFSREHVDQLYGDLLAIFNQAERENKTTNQVAIERAEHYLHQTT